MKKTKSNLDELQELKLLKIEHNGCWLAFWGLLAVILTQIILKIRIMLHFRHFQIGCEHWIYDH